MHDPRINVARLEDELERANCLLAILCLYLKMYRCDRKVCNVSSLIARPFYATCLPVTRSDEGTAGQKRSQYS